MPTVRHPLLASSVAAACVISLAACGGGESEAADTATLTVGYLGNITGDASGPFGVPFDNGMNLALEEIESSGYLDDEGLSVDVITEDTGSELNTAVTQYNQLRDKSVDVIVSDSMSTIAAGIAPLATSDGMLFLTGAGSKMENTDGWAWHLADLGTPMRTLGSQVAAGGAKKVVAVVDGDNPSFQTMADAFEAGMEEEGGNILADTVTVAASDTDFSSLVTTLEDSGADGVIVSVLPEQAGNIVRQIDQAGVSLQSVGTIAWSGQVYEVAEGAAVGAPFALPWAPGLPESADFEKSYQDAYDAAPNAYSAMGYETAWLLAVAAKQVVDAGDEVSQDTLKAQLVEASTSADLAEHGVISDFSLTAEGDPSYPGVVATFNETGDIVAVQP